MLNFLKHPTPQSQNMAAVNLNNCSMVWFFLQANVEGIVLDSQFLKTWPRKDNIF